MGTGYAQLIDATQEGPSTYTEEEEPSVELKGAVQQTCTRIAALADPDVDTKFRIAPILEQEAIELQSDSSD